MRAFKRADILLPKDCDMMKWSVVACDQFTSEPEYWAKLERDIADAPSTLRLMLPEAHLESRDQFAEAERINATMEDYLDRGVFRTLPDSYVYVERTQADGRLRRGLIGVLDLEEYDYSKTSRSLIRATEGTVEERLPPRVRVRRGAPIEMPHIMVFIDDRDNCVMDCAAAQKPAMEKLYDFTLSGGGGNVAGWRAAGESADALERELDKLCDADTLMRRYGGEAPAVFAMGDGNHSLATAKLCWEEIKAGLDPAERGTHPARYSLVELVNIHDPAISFEPIHRVIFNTDPASFVAEAEHYFARLTGDGDTEHKIRLVTSGCDKTVSVRGLTIGKLIASAEQFCTEYMSAHGGRVDYIHNDDTAISLGRQPGSAGLLLPRMEKDELFPSIISSGPFPKKSFSIGHAQDKRYYLECRRIK